MKFTNSKIRYVIIVALLLAYLAPSSEVFAAHELELQPKQEEPEDPHLSWHQFEHELNSFGSVRAHMSHEGIVTLTGHIDDGVEIQRIVTLARKVAGAVEIVNLIFSD